MLIVATHTNSTFPVDVRIIFITKFLVFFPQYPCYLFWQIFSNTVEVYRVCRSL